MVEEDDDLSGLGSQVAMQMIIQKEEQKKQAVRDMHEIQETTNEHDENDSKLDLSNLIERDKKFNRRDISNVETPKRYLSIQALDQHREQMVKEDLRSEKFRNFLYARAAAKNFLN